MSLSIADMPGAALSVARDLDQADPLRKTVEQFHIPRLGTQRCIYLCGNSLGLQPHAAATYVHQELDEWRNLGVLGHFKGLRPWARYHELAAGPTATLVGAHEDEVVCMNSLTVNLHLMLTTFYRPEGARRKILIEQDAFPSDRYAVQSHLDLHGLNAEQGLIEIAPRPGEQAVRTEDLLTYIDQAGPEIALVLLPGVQYYTGEVYDMAAITRHARKAGARVGFDLAHAIGNIPLALHEWNADFAVWCTYKYLNAGPGAVAGCFVHQRHSHQATLPRLAGWWGHDKATRFQMGPNFSPIDSAEGWQLSNPPILAFAPLLASLQMFDDTGMEALRAKSLQLSGYLQLLLTQQLDEQIQIITPLNPARRGCQLSLRVRQGARQGRALFEALEAHGVIGDWREPDVIRIAPVPLYNRFEDVFAFVSILRQLVLPDLTPPADASGPHIGD